MHLPADHPLLTDEALIAYAGGIDEICSTATFESTLRYLPGRRVAMKISHPDVGPCVLKVFASPRGRGNHRRLCMLAASNVGDILPTPYGIDRSGHVCLVDYSPGVVLDTLSGSALIEAASATGAALRRLHGSGAVLDRSWTIADEIRLLTKRATPLTEEVSRRLAGRTADLGSEPMISAHRDCHPRQVVVDPTGVRWIDLDDAAMAPAGLDVGNFIAHVRRDGLLGTIPAGDAEEATTAFLAAYGQIDSDVELWEQLSLARLAALAERRHGRPEDASAILHLLATRTRR